MSLPLLWAFLSRRRFRARLLSTLLCTILLVLRPFSHFGGTSAYLVLTVNQLVFSAQENLPQQIEATILHLLGGLAGVVLSTAGQSLAYLSYGSTGLSPLSRSIPAVTLTLICFVAGWLKSRLPRLTLASRIACFVSIWLLTYDVGPLYHTRNHAIHFVWMVMTASVISLFSCMIVLKWSSTQFATEMAKAFSEMRLCLHSSLQNSYPPDEKLDKEKDKDKDKVQSSTYIHPTELLKRSISLDALYQQASFELRIGRISVKSLKPLITTVEHLRRILSRRITIPQPCMSDEAEDASVVEAFHTPALELGIIILQTLEVIEHEILLCYENSIMLKKDNSSRATDLQLRLFKFMKIAREHLQEICDDLDGQKRLSSGEVELPSKVFDSCTCMIHLLQLAQEVQLGLRTIQEIRTCYNTSKARLWYPHFSLAWLGIAPTMVSLDEGSTFLDEGNASETTALSEREALQGIAEKTHEIDEDGEDYVNTVVKRTRLVGRPLSRRWFKSLFYYLWNHPKSLRARLRLSKALKSLEHSPHLRHAFKNAAGVALLSVPAFLPYYSEGNQWFKTFYGQWMIISYVWVLETNTGATWRVAYLRLCGTIIGAIYAYIMSLICRSNPYALVVAMTVAELPISWVIIKTSFSPLGTVAAVTIPPILFTPYFLEDVSTWRLALLRSVLISGGIIAALLANSLLFPRHCRVLFLNNACQIIGLSNQLFMNISRNLFHHNHASAVHRKRTHKMEREIRTSLYRLAVLLKTMNDEISLVPKPMKRYRQILNVLHQLSNLLTGLRKMGQHIPKKELLAAVAPQRRELVSCLCLSLFASEQVFRARQPLPQFLPSSRMAYIALEREVEEQVLQSEQSEHESSGLSLIYVFAELDLLAELVDCVDELLESTRHLFGTSSWLNQINTTPMHSTAVASMYEEIGHVSTIHV